MFKKPHNPGFTVIEIAVVLAISATLLLMASMQLTKAQVNSRNSERREDLNMIAQCLQNRFIATQEFYSTVAELESCPKASDILTPPGQSTPNTVKAINNEQSFWSSQPSPQNNDRYVFQPLTSSGALCTNPVSDPCTKFKLYVHMEGGEGWSEEISDGR